MLWIFRRDNQELRVEARLGGVDRQYVIRVLWPDGREQLEIFGGDAPFRLRLTEFESQLREQKWIGSAGRILNDDAELKPTEAAPPEHRTGQRDRRRYTRRDRRSRNHAKVVRQHGLRDRNAIIERERGSIPGLDPDDAFIGLLIAAMDASGHVSAEEAARAHHIIWSMRRFRHRSGETVGPKIERMRALIERHGAPRVIEASAKKIPTRLRGAAFAVATDLVLVDGRLERAEGQFLRRFADHLRLPPETAASILDVIRIKNRA